MEARPIIFLDDGGVITDPARRTAAWRRLAGDVFATLLGGDAAAWGEAHRVVTARLFADDRVRMRAAVDFVSFYRAYELEWIAGMHRHMGLPAPSEAACLALAERATAEITARMRAALPGAAEAIRALQRAGYTLHTASGAASEQLAGCLEGMGVRGCFGRLYGTDPINTFKEGPEYYARLFADVGVQPGEALVVDDSLDALAWAAHVGARTLLIGPPRPARPPARPRALASASAAASAGSPRCRRSWGRRGQRAADGGPG
jgi:HAD superfamily hydrolase (TIGR01509 family)